jgi:hypothetical protein
MYNFIFNACLQDWYDNGHFDPEAQVLTQSQPHTTTNNSDILVRPLLNTVQPREALPAVRQAQSLGLGLPPVARQSESVRRRVTPIPSGQFCTPPILDHDSDLSNETPPSPSHAPAPADQLPTNQPPTDQPPTDQPPIGQPPNDQPPVPGPSKRGKTRGPGSKTSKASGGQSGRGGSRQRAKATASTDTIE